MILEGGQMGEVMGGYFIRRVVSPQVKLRLLLTSSAQERVVVGPTHRSNNNIENLMSPIARRVAGRDPVAKPRRSPLPNWYPRTPLRDITLVLKAVERMNLRGAMTPQQMGPAQIQLQTPEPTNSILSSQIQPLKPDPTVLDFTPIRVARTPEVEAYEKKLTESIEKLERIVKRNMKREKLKQNTAARVSRKDGRCKVLLSMR